MSARSHAWWRAARVLPVAVPAALVVAVVALPGLSRDDAAVSPRTRTGVAPVPSLILPRPVSPSSSPSPSPGAACPAEDGAIVDAGAGLHPRAAAPDGEAEAGATDPEASETDPTCP